MPKYKVKRPHIGDRDYKVGDVREANARVVAHLVANGVLEPIKDAAVAAKKAPAAKNKAAPAAQNKSGE